MCWQLRPLGAELQASTGFQLANFKFVVQREQALHKAALQRFDAQSYSGGAYTHDKVSLSRDEGLGRVSS